MLNAGRRPDGLAVTPCACNLMLGDSLDTYLLTKVAKLQHLPPLRGVHKHFLENDSNLVHDGMSFRTTTEASFPDAVTLERRGILFKTLMG